MYYSGGMGHWLRTGTHCAYGHELTPENHNGSTHRPCRRCTRAYSRAFNLGITLAVYMQNEDYLDGLFDAPHPRLDWSVRQHCPDCGREMRPNKPAPPEDTRVTYGGKGRCKTCRPKMV